MRHSRYIVATLLLALVTGAALLPDSVKAMDETANANESGACVEERPVATKGSPCPIEQTEQRDPPPMEVSQLHTRGRAIPAGVMLMAMAFLSLASGVALGRAVGPRPPVIDR